MRILIVTYTFPPSISVNGFRPYYFSKALLQQGYEVHVCTRHFTGIETFNQHKDTNLTPFSISREEGLVVFRTPFENTWFRYYKYSWIKKSGLWKFIYLIQLAVGRTTQESYNRWFKPYLKKLLMEYQYDLVLVESGPTNLVRSVSQILHKTDIPFVIDFRDVYYHEMLMHGLLPLNKRIKIFFEEWYMRKSIKRANFIIGESKAKLEAMGIPDKNSEIIHNGYDEELWNAVEQKESDEFRILIAGTLYENANLKTFLDGLALFQQNQYSDSKICFIAPGSPEIITKIESSLNHFNLEIIRSRIPYTEVISLMKQSQVLAYHGWNGYKGVYSTKIFDYIRSGKKVWIVPSDHDVIADLINEFLCGLATDDPVIGAEQLKTWYTLWKSGDRMQDKITEKIEMYSRQRQSEKIVEIVKNIIVARN